MYAAVIRAADRWRGLTVGEFEQRQLRAIREELDRAHVERVPPPCGPPRVRRPSNYPQGPDLTPGERGRCLNSAYRSSKSAYQ